ncbi:MAG: S-layer homology domain-containing protein [Candidatus Gracilibacteria bacterium]|jgi:hypothetical protein
MSKTNWIKRALSHVSIVAIIATSLFVQIASATIISTDYFTMTADVSSVSAGGNVTLTISSKDSVGAANVLEGSDFAYVEIHNPSNNGISDADITTIGGNAALKASQATPWNATTAANIAGTNDTLVAVNFTGDSVGTVTVKAGNANFQVFVWAPIASMNGVGETPLPGQDMQSITVTAGTGAAHHLIASSAVDTAEVNQEITYVITQVNEGGGTDTTALADVGVALAVNGTGVGTITKVNNIAVGTPGTSVANMALTAGVGTVTVVVSSIEGSTGAVTITPSSATLAGLAVVDTSVLVSSATALTIQGYGPPNGQVGMPTNAPVDVMFNKDPDPTDTIFPLTNTASSVLSLTTGGTAVTGQWNLFSENWGGNTTYRVAFQASTPLTASTLYTATILKESFAPAVSLPDGTTALTDNGAVSRSFQLITGTGGGTFTAPPDGQPGTGAGGFSGGYTGTMGGEFPPMAFLSYPMPGAGGIPTNPACITVGFDRAMLASTLTTTNIYIKKLVNNTESTPAGSTPVVTALEGNKSVCISGYILEASTKYRVVVTREVKDAKGTQLAGMPESNGTTSGTMGFGYSNMGPFRQEFTTGTGAGAATAPTLMGLNINQYKSGANITGVPTSMNIRASFGAPLNPSTVNSTNITLKRNGTVPEAGSVFYDAMSNSIEFVPTSALSGNTSYTFAASTSVTSVTGTAISALSSTFTTGTTDNTKPQLVYAEADNYGINLQFNEALNETKATDRSYYTLKTCLGGTMSSDGATCSTGAVTTVSLVTGVTAHYERMENSVWMDGLTLTSGDGFYIGVSTGVTDVAGIEIHATNNKSWTGVIMGSDNFAGGQGMFNMGTIGMEDFDMKTMGMKPINAMPMNTMAGTTTKYFIDVPIGTAVPTGGYMELTFPTGFVVTGAKRDAQSPMNSDFNGPSTGTVTFATTIPTITGLTDTETIDEVVYGVADDGVGYITAARKVIIKLSGATQANDFMHFDIDGIKNSSEPKSFDTSGYSIDIKTFNSTGTLLEAMTTMPFFIASAGTNTISGQVTAGGSGVNGVRVFLDSRSGGFQETTTSLNGAGDLVAGSNAGEYTFGNLPNGNYNIHIAPQYVGATDYSEANYNIDGVTAAKTQNIVLTAQNNTNCATLPITVNIANIGNITSIGASDSIDVFGWGPGGGFTKTLTRTQVTNSVATPVNVYLCTTGMYNIGIGPSMPKGNFSAFPKMEWIPPQNQNVNVLTTDIDGTKTTFATTTFAVSAPDATITGIVKDSAGTAVSGGKVFADFSAGGFGGDTDIGVDGTFSIPASKGKSYRVGGFIPGMPPAPNRFVTIDNTNGVVYIDGSPAASTGSSGANPLVITMQFNSANSLTVSGRVSDGTNAIAGAGVWAHRTDAQRPPANGFTDSSGNYILYIPEAGTWQVEANAPGLGFLGSKTLTVTTEDFTGQDFEPLATASMGIIAGDISVPGTTDDSGVVVTAHNADGYFNTAITEEDGTYTMDVPKDTDAYTVTAWSPTLGNLAKTTQVVDGTETVSPATLGDPQTLTITLTEDVSDDTRVDLTSTTGMGTSIVIPAGETEATIKVPAGDYYIDYDLPFDETGVVPSGGEVNTTTMAVNFDGTGDDITLTVPTLHTVSGTIAQGATGIENAVVTIVDTVTMDTFTVLTDSNGDYTAEVPSGTYSILPELTGYVGTPEDLPVAGDLPNQDIALDPADKTITGTITNSVGSPVEGALVYATMAGGGMATAETNSSGVYTMNVSDGMWNVEAVTDGYVESVAPLAVDAQAANVTGANIQLPATTVALVDPATTTIDSGNANQFADPDMDINVIVPANAVDADAVINFGQTNELPTTPSAAPFSTGIEITATTTNDSSPVNSFDNSVKIEFEYTVAELATEGITTTAGMETVGMGYMNKNTNNWTDMPSTTTYYDSTGAFIPRSTIDDYTTIAAAVTGVDLTKVILSAYTDHLTTFAPIVSSGATPPATPSGLTATAGDGQVTLSWTKNSEADMSYYNIWEANVTEGVSTTLTQAACTVTPCTKTITSLTNGTAYAFQVAAVDTPDGDSSAYCTAVNSTPVAATVTTPGGGPVSTGGSSSSKKDTTKKETVTEEDKTAETDATTDATAETSSETATTSIPLKDVAGHWAQSYVEDLYTKQIVSGADATHYNPDKPITRAEFTKIVINMYDIPMQDAESVTSSFKDVKESEWYAAYIQAAYDKGLVAGYTDKTFNPNKPITRAEAMKIILSASGKEILDPITDDGTFKDVKLKDWYAKYVLYAAANGIVGGYEDKTFQPNNPITRAEVAKIASLLLKDNIVSMIMGIVN